MIEQLSGLPLEFSPGTAWNYSVSIDVMGYLVQKLSGMSFGEFLRTRLFEPLGMSDTAFWCPPEKIDRFASCYQPRSGRWTASCRTMPAKAPMRRRQTWNPAAAAWSRPRTTTCASAG